MSLNTLTLSGFRNFNKKDLNFSDGTNVIVGDNAVGKTNILESIALLSTGKSFKAKLEIEMVSLGQNIARVSGKTNNDQLEVVISVNPKRKKFLVNGVAKRLVDFAGNLKTVVFAPQDLDLVTASPSLRRKFLDSVLSQVDREYRRSLLSYEKGLRQRNRLLFRIREEGLSRTQLLFWDNLLIKNGDYLTNARSEFIEFVNDTPSIDQHEFSIHYDKSVVSPARIEQYARQEVASATTLVGPHRDDFAFFEKNSHEREMASFGSRGEQRMAVLWLKSAELGYIKKKTSESPTLLLDDIFSELDHDHRKHVFELSDNQQTIITTADPHFLLDKKYTQRIDL